MSTHIQTGLSPNARQSSPGVHAPGPPPPQGRPSPASSAAPHPQVSESGRQKVVDRHAEELRRKRRQEEVSKAKMMMEIVGDSERRELEAMFPELLDGPSLSQRSNFFLDDADEDILPKAYIYMGPELVETPLGGVDTEIDFGLTGCRVTMRDFVGLRPIPRFSKVPALPSTFVPEKEPSPLETARRLATNLGESLKGTWQWLADKKPFGLELPSPGRVLPPQDPVVILPAHSAGGAAEVGEFEAAAVAAAAGGVNGRGAGSPVPGSLDQGGGAHENGAREPDPGAAPLEPYSQLGKWEIVWKDHSMLGVPVRRLEFACNPAGLTAIRDKLSTWQQLATSAAAMLEASQAAVKANGGIIPENPGVWLPRGMPESALNYLRTYSKEKEDSARLESGDGQARNEPPSDGTGGAGQEAQVSISDAPGTPRAEGGSTLPSPGGGMSAAEMAAAGVVEGENIMRWGSVSVLGKFLPRRSGDSLILRPGHFMALAVALPARLRPASWSLLYSTARDGISLGTMYRKLASRRGPCVLIVRDSQKCVFGSFTSEEWKPMTKYYGNGECFVFQVQPQVQAFKWTHANSYFMFSTPNSLAIGGGNHYAFSLNSDLLSGYSGPCETFGSVPLAGSEEFEAVLVECWGLR